MRLIDADNLKGLFDSHTWQGDMMITAVDNTPTAYDVDKVVEQLEHMDRTPLYEDENSEEIIDYLLEQSEVIEIVKGGGMDE